MPRNESVVSYPAAVCVAGRVVTSYMDPVDTSIACNILRYAWCVRPDLAKAVSCAEPIAKDSGAMSAKASWFALFTRGLASPPLASI